MQTFTVHFDGQAWSVLHGQNTVMAGAEEGAAMRLALDLVSRAYEQGQRAEAVVTKAGAGALSDGQ